MINSVALLRKAGVGLAGLALASGPALYVTGSAAPAASATSQSCQTHSGLHGCTSYQSVGNSSELRWTALISTGSRSATQTAKLWWGTSAGYWGPMSETFYQRGGYVSTVQTLAVWRGKGQFRAGTVQFSTYAEF